MARSAGAFTNAFSRVWFLNGGPKPGADRQYHGNWKAGAVSWDRGDRTVIREPDPNQYGKFINVGSFRGEPGNPELPLTARFGFQRSELLRAARADCEHALQVHIGVCENPQDFNRGWEKTLILEGAIITTYGTEDLGALSADENAAVNEDVSFQGTDWYEVRKMTFAELAAATIVRPITSVYICDTQQCGACGVASDGCQIIVALQSGDGTTNKPSVLYSVNGGASWASSIVTPMAVADTADEVLCIGNYTFVLSDTAVNSFYILTSDLVRGIGTWTAMPTGFVATKGPIAGHSLGASDTWIVGSDGYIYTTDDLLSGVVVSDAGNAAITDLLSVNAYDSNNVVAVGVSNVVVRTANGGTSWEAIVGPAVGVALNAVWAYGPDNWLVGSAAGRLYYTDNAGLTWTEVAFPGSGVGAVRDIKFVTPSVGYMAHNTVAPAGRVLRTIDGGKSWYVMPEGTGSIPVIDYISQLAVCDDPNVVFGGGLHGNGTDGVLVKAA